MSQVFGAPDGSIPEGSLGRAAGLPREVSREMYDQIIVGQGLAGTALAWALLERGQRVLVVDRGERITASRIAAGLITPVIGKRLTVPWRFREFRESAHRHYRQIENRAHVELLSECTAIRLFHDEQETGAWEQRRQALHGLVEAIDPPAASGVKFCAGGFQMPASAMLHVLRYLDVSRREFEAINAFRQAEIRATEMQVTDDHVVLNAGEFIAREVVFCQGFAAAKDGLFSSLRFDATKGEILTLRIPGLAETRTVHAAGSWLTPTHESGVYRFGATYDWDDLTSTPTEIARQKLSARLEQVVSLPIEIIEQHAAVRPTVVGRLPVLGRHPRLRRVVCFNGLGSRGALTAPGLATMLADHLLQGTPLPPEIDSALRGSDAGSADTKPQQGAN